MARMSQELKTLAKSFIGAVADEFIKLMETVPADKWTWKPEPITLSAQEIACHVAIALYFVAPNLRGEKVSRPADQWVAQFKAEHQTPERLKTVIERSLNDIYAAIDHLKDFDQPFQMYWGVTWPAKDVLFRGCAEHTAYHGGQLAYIQRLLGDTKDHF